MNNTPINYSRHINGPRSQNVGGAIVTRVSLDLTGELAGKVTVTDAGTAGASLTVELANQLVMHFFSAYHVQHVAGFLALARQAGFGLAPDHSAAWPQAHNRTGGIARTVLTWTSAPAGTAERREFAHPISGKVWPLVSLTLRPITLTVLDRAALDSLLDLMGRAHAAAVANLPDGAEATANPLAPSWKPRAVAHRTIGEGWIDNHA